MSFWISLPWQLGHVVAIGAIGGGFEDLDPVTVGATALLYPLLGVMLWTAVRGDGQTLHDRVAGTRVSGSAGLAQRKGSASRRRGAPRLIA